MRRFYIQREYDVSGVSGLGIVAMGVEFPDGRVVMRWIVPPSSTSFWDCVDEVVAIHGHEGSTKMVFIDENSGFPDEIASLVEDIMSTTGSTTKA